MKTIANQLKRPQLVLPPEPATVPEYCRTCQTTTPHAVDVLWNGARVLTCTYCKRERTVTGGE